MLDDLLKYDKLGSKDELTFILFQAISPHEFKHIENIKILCLGQNYTFGGSFYGILRLLELLQLITVDGDLIKADQIILSYNQNKFFTSTIFFERLFGLLNEYGRLKDLFNSETTKYDLESQAYFIKENRTPFYLSAIKKLLINTEFLFIPDNIPNVYFLNSIFFNFFKSTILPSVQIIPVQKRLSLKRLKFIQELQNLAGERAERFVLLYEQYRLSNHPLKSDIKIVSSDFVNAGYDIESYQSDDSISIDKFIEVKSYGGRIKFYWSKNEIEIAKLLGDNYYLYLIDRKQVNESNYTPLIIKNPYKYLFIDTNWKISPDSYLIQE